MKEIKFRAWDNKQMEYSKPMPDFGFWKWAGYSSTTKIMQYTGLKDKNGKEIYEGDKILDSNSVVWIVSFGAGSFVATMMGGSDRDSLYSVIDKEVEVIGNIYQEEATP